MQKTNKNEMTKIGLKLTFFVFQITKRLKTKKVPHLTQPAKEDCILRWGCGILVWVPTVATGF